MTVHLHHISHSALFKNSIEQITDTKALLFLFLHVDVPPELWESVCYFWRWKGRKSLPFSCFWLFHVVCSTTSHYATHHPKHTLSKTADWVVNTFTNMHFLQNSTFNKMTHNKCGLFPFFCKREILDTTLSRSH